ncbi:uncharacterized protein LOC143573474, partial [Bidens hawaiensis]|uniref:uncharacterized protein LOC143573474 n=1 Tax=Bidens hawaiensis TaxID=980011 RepID=UPI00404B18A9
FYQSDTNGVQTNIGFKAAHTKLQDIWEIYDEWSCCGVDVPILLETGESIVQYYVPYLSAIQIFINKTTPTGSNHYNDEDTNDNNLTNLGCSSYEDHLYVQFNESCSPYMRVPFLDKIIELAQNYPGLLTFNINEISPASWMSVAWYPIFHIPASIYSKNLCTCFLTFHTLSSSFQVDNDEEGDQEALDLVPFGLATYKMQGDVWNNRDKGDDEKIKDLESAAYSWLKQLRVQHHDFNFFTQ